MKIDQILSEEIIDLSIDASTKLAALNQLIDLLHTDGRISSKEDFLDEVLKREEIESTDFGIGVAIPHGRCAAVLQPSVAIGKMKAPIPWDPDQKNSAKPISSIFLLATSPDDQAVSHMEIIAQVAALLIEEKFIQFLDQNTDPRALLNEINTYLGENKS